MFLLLYLHLVRDIIGNFTYKLSCATLYVSYVIQVSFVASYD